MSYHYLGSFFPVDLLSGINVGEVKELIENHTPEELARLFLIAKNKLDDLRKFKQ